MVAYISVSFSKRKLFDTEISTIINTLQEFKITPFLFVDVYKFGPNEERQMMQQAMTDIDKCDLLLAETSDKGIGIGLEVGYAKAKGKPVIYICQKEAEHSTTVSGISDFQIVYSGTFDLRQKLVDTLNVIVTSV
jgi:nucleoside 2-deoxyribosyltransferase